MIAFLDERLEAADFEDHCPNGLQVPGSADVSLVVTGVSAHLELFERAAAIGAGLILCHHGIFWRSQPRVIWPEQKARLKALFDADMSLAAYHLPLDAHPELGNNALICAELGLERGERFGTAAGRPIGFVAHAGEPIDVAALAERCRAAFGRAPLVLGDPGRKIASLGVVSGGGASMLADAVAQGLDGLITGEPSEPAMADAREAGVAFLACGHYATETFGIRRIGELLGERFDVEHRFLEAPNPV
ncbi:MAG: Nif3-like dinuclear metal center hexameric protein [Thermoleophilaceae bacterium]